MSRKIVTAIAAIAGLAVLASISLPNMTSAARPPASDGGAVASKVKDTGVARSGAWTFEGKADLDDFGVLELKVRSTTGAPRSFDMVSRLLVGRDVRLLNSGVRVVDLNGRTVALGRLDDAILRVKGTLLPAGQWRYDLDREATPTVRVSRITVLGLDF